MHRPLALAAGIAACFAGSLALAAPLTSAFTYQGRLSVSGQPANGSYDLRFTLFDVNRNGTPLGAAVSLEDVAIANGVFSVPLDFGFAVANGERLYVALEVREGASRDAFTALSPRHELSPSVYALHALEAEQALVAGPGSVTGASVVDGALTAADLAAGAVGTDEISNHSIVGNDIALGTITNFNIAADAIAGSSILNDTLTAQDIAAGAVGSSELAGGAVTAGKIALNAIGADQVDSAAVQRRVNGTCAVGSSIRAITPEGSVSCEPDDEGVPGWQQFGNVGTNGAAHYLGTGDNQPFSLRVNNKRVARFEPGTISPNVLMGSEFNTLSAGVRGATVAGGGANANTDPDFANESSNIVSDAYGTVGGGATNYAGNLSGTAIDAAFATVAGGQSNSALAPYATIAGGARNIVLGAEGFAAGADNVVSGANGTALGKHAHAVHAGTFVWSDTSSMQTFQTATTDQFLVRARNGLGVNTNANVAALNVERPADAGVDHLVAHFNGGDGLGRIVLRGDLGTEIGFNSQGSGAFIKGEGGTLRLEPARPGTRSPQFRMSATESFDGIGVATFSESIVVMSAQGFNGNALQLNNGNASKPGGGSWAMASDARLKRDVQPLEGALDRLLALRGVTYEYKDPHAPGLLPGRQNGFIAQEVQRVFPDWVTTQNNGFLSVSVRGFEALTVEALRELSESQAASLEAQDAAIHRLESDNAALRASHSELAARLARLEGKVRQ